VIAVSNTIGIIVGVAFVVLGFVLLVAWWSMFIKALMAIVPMVLILIGAGVLAYFISETKSKIEAAPEKGSEPDEKKPGDK
jgi:multisubunit Na+/H+ antiporter MnhG subunit